MGEEVVHHNLPYILDYRLDFIVVGEEVVHHNLPYILSTTSIGYHLYISYLAWPGFALPTNLPQCWEELCSIRDNGEILLLF